MYYINYNTGAGNTTAETLEDAMKIADEGAAYTQEKIDIKDDDNNIVATRFWYGVEYKEDSEEPSENPIYFGSFGFYDDWIIF